MEVCLYSGLVQAIQLSYSVEAERRSVVVGIRWSLLKSSLALGAERLCGPRRIELQGSLCSENGTSSWIVLVVREGTAESWSLNLSSNLTGCSCGKNVVVIAAKALSFVDVFAISASNFRWNSSCFTRNLLLESLTFFSSMANSDLNSATLALAIATDEARLPRDFTRLRVLKA